MTPEQRAADAIHEWNMDLDDKMGLDERVAAAIRAAEDAAAERMRERCAAAIMKTLLPVPVAIILADSLRALPTREEGE